MICTDKCCNEIINKIILFENKRENMLYNIPVKYAKKSFGQSFVDYLGPTYFNSMSYEYKKKHPSASKQC